MPTISAQDNYSFTPRSITINSVGVLLISDDIQHQILRLESSGIIEVLLTKETVDPASGRKVDLGRPVGVALDGLDNLYVTDRNTHRVFRIDSQSGAVTTVAGNREFGYRYDNVLATEASLSSPVGVALDREGNLYIVEQSNRRIRRVDIKSGQITTMAGSGKTGFSGNGGPAIEASFNVPFDVVVDHNGNIFIADTGNHRIRRVSAKTGIITTVVGNGKDGFNGDSGPAIKASLSDPFDLAIDRHGNLYVADTGNRRIRRVDAKTQKITTVLIKPFSMKE